MNQFESLLAMCESAKISLELEDVEGGPKMIFLDAPGYQITCSATGNLISINNGYYKQLQKIVTALRTGMTMRKN